MDNKSLQDIALEYRNQGRSREEFEASVSNTLDTLRDSDGTPMVNRDQLMSQTSALASSIFDNPGLGEEAPEQEQVAQIPEMSEPPIEMVDDMFADPVSEDTTFFDNLPEIGSPMSTPRAGELGTIAGYVMGETPEDAADIGMQVQSDLEVSGYSSYLEDVKNLFLQESIDDLHAALWENEEYLMMASEDPSEGREIRKDVEKAKIAVRGGDRTSQLIADTVRDMTPEARESFLEFAPIMEETLYARAVEDMFSAQSTSELEKTNIWKIIGTYLNPAQALAGRNAQNDFLNLMKERLGEDYDHMLNNQYLWKREHVDILNDFLIDPDIPLSELHERLDYVEEMFKELTLENDFNPVWTSELFDLIRTGLQNQDVTVNLGEVIDSVDVLDVTIVVDLLRIAGRVAGSRLFGRAAMSSHANRTQTREVMEVMDELRAEYAGFLPDQPRLPAPDQPISGLLPFKRVQPTELEQAVGESISGRGNMWDAINRADKSRAERILRDVLSNEDIESIAQLGLTPEMVAERIFPGGVSDFTRPGAFNTHGTAADSANVSPLRRQFLREYGNFSTVDLLTEPETFAIADRFAALASSRSRGTLRTSASKVESINEDGSVTIDVVFGSKDGGYQNLAEATEAGRFLFGTPHTIKAKRSGRDEPLRPVTEFDKGDRLDYYVSINAKIKPSSAYAQAFTDDVTLQFPGAGYIQSPDMRVEREMMDGVNNYADHSTRLRTLGDRMLEDIMRMRDSRKNKRTFNDSLIWSDENETIFTNLNHMRQQFPDTNESVFRAYRAARDYFDTLADIRQRAVYNELNDRGYRSIVRDGKLMDDGDGPIYGRPISGETIQRESGEDIIEVVLIPRLRDNVPGPTAQVGDNEIWGTEIWDATSGQSVRLTQELVDEIYKGTDLVIVRNSRFYNTPEGKQHSFSIVPINDFKMLPLRPMNERKGHIDLYYRSEPELGDILTGRTIRQPARRTAGDSYKLEIELPVIRDGVRTTYRRAVGIGRSRSDMANIRTNLLSDPETLGRYGVPRNPDGTINEEAFHIVPTRESSTEFGMNQAGTPTGIPAHARQRGERLLGPSGLAETLDPIESISRSMGDARRILGKDIIDVQRNRFIEKFHDVLEGGSSYPTSREQIVPRAGLDNPEQVKRDADAFFDIIESWETAVNGPAALKMTQNIRNWVDGLIDDPNALKRAMGKGMKPMTNTDFLSLAKGTTASFFIAARPLYQILANSAIAINFAIADPKAFAKSAPGTVAFLARMASSKDKHIPFKDQADYFYGWMFGKPGGVTLTGPEMKAISDGLTESGLVSTEFGNDLYSVINEGIRLEAGRHNVLSSSFWTRNVPGLGGVERAGRLGYFVGRLGTDYAKTQAYVHSMYRIIAEKGKDYAVSRRGIKEAAAEAQRLTFNQNRMAPFKHQHGPVSVFMQFTQHVQRMFMQLIADPAVRSVPKAGLAMSKDMTNPYTTTSAKAIWSMAGVVGLYGVSAFSFSGKDLPLQSIHDTSPEEVAKWLEDRGISRRLTSIFLSGMTGASAEEALGARTNITSRIGPIGVLRTTLEMAFTNDGGLILGGPAAGLWDLWGNTSKLAQAVLTTQDIDPQDALSLMVQSAGNMFSGLRDAEKAWLIYSMSKHYTSGGRELDDADAVEALAASFGITMERIESMFRSQSMVFEARDEANFMVNAMEKAFNLDLSFVPEEERTLDTAVDLFETYAAIIDSWLGDSPLASDTKNSLLRRMIRDNGPFERNIGNIVDSLDPRTARQRLIIERRNLRHDNESGREYIDFWIEMLDRRIEELSEQGTDK